MSPGETFIKTEKLVGNKKIFFRSFIAGLAWMLGATFGFAILLAILDWLGGLPIIGNFIATIVELTNQALKSRQNLLM